MEESQARKGRLRAIAAAHASADAAPMTSFQELPKPFADEPSQAPLPESSTANDKRASQVPTEDVAHAPTMHFVPQSRPSFAPQQLSGSPKFFPRWQDDRFPKRGRMEGGRKRSQQRERVMEGCRYFKRSMNDDPWVEFADEPCTS
eukprot:scaffold217_cov341-Pavlova_lutheri.AAC.3